MVLLPLFETLISFSYQLKIALLYVHNICLLLYSKKKSLPEDKEVY